MKFNILMLKYPLPKLKKETNFGTIFLLGGFQMKVSLTQDVEDIEKKI